MATRAAIAAADRKSREEIADKDRRFAAKKWAEQKKIEEYNAHTDRVTKSASAAGQMARGAGSLVKKNDPEWYKRYGYNPYAAALPDFYRLGSEMYNKWRSSAVGGSQNVVPGILVFEYQDTLPNQNETNVVNTYYQNSPINISLTRFMANLRKLNSRIGDYDPADLGLYWYAIRSYITVIGILVKALTVYNTYYATNAYFARILIEAIGFDFDNFKSNIAEYKLLCERHINLFNANAVIPTQLSFILRGIWLATALVKDHEGDHSQIYTFRPYSVGHLNTDENSVVYSKVSYPLSYATVSNRLDLDASNLFNSQGVVTMMSDLRAAYGNGVLQFSPDYNGQAVFSDSKHDLEQIHNLQTLPVFMDEDGEFACSELSKLNIFQDNDGFLRQGDATSNIIATWPAFFEDMAMDDLQISSARVAEYLNFYDEDSVNPDMYLESTRLRFTIFASKATNINGRLFRYNGTEIVVKGVMYTALPYPNTNHYTIEFFGTDIAVLNNGYAVFFDAIHQYSTFDWLPKYRLFYCDGTEYDGGPSMWCDFGEIDHAVTLPQANLKWLHEVATLSEFYTDPVAPGRK